MKIQKLWQLCLLVSAVSLGLNPLPSLAQSTDAPPEGTVKIEGFAYGGTGCPQGSVGSIISKDQTTIELLFDKFVAELDQKATQFSSTSNCAVAFNIQYPDGWSLSWDRVEHRGFADTTGGARAQLRTRYYIPGNGEFDVNRVYNFPNNDVEDYTVVQDNLASAYTQCGATVPVSVDSRVRLYGTPTGFNTLTVDSLTNKVRTILHFNWRRCS